MLVEPPGTPNLAPQCERPPELDPDHRPRLRAPARVQHLSQDRGSPDAVPFPVILPLAGMLELKAARTQVFAKQTSSPKSNPYRLDCSPSTRSPVPRMNERGLSAG
jgi:hypothetical protein